MAKYRCSKCQHIWDGTRMPKLCPYCGKENTVEEAEIRDMFMDIDDMLK